jgi:lipopolysaccharide export system protein LptC
MHRQAMTSTIDELAASGFAAPARTDSDKVFLRARRHSRMVRVLRVALPAGAVAIVVGIIAFSWLDPMRILSRLPTAGGQLVISGTKITMASPRLSGFTKDARPYELNARTAAQDVTKPDFVELTDIRAKMESKDKMPITVTAIDGLYNRKSGILKLAGDVLMTTPSYEVSLVEATVDTNVNSIVSEKPVQVKMLQGTLNSNRLEVSGGGELVRFIGDVKLILDNLPEQGGKAALR